MLARGNENFRAPGVRSRIRKVASSILARGTSQSQKFFQGLCSSSVTEGSISAALSCLVRGRNAGSFPEQRLVIEPSVTAAHLH